MDSERNLGAGVIALDAVEGDVELIDEAESEEPPRREVAILERRHRESSVNDLDANDGSIEADLDDNDVLAVDDFTNSRFSAEFLNDHLEPSRSFGGQSISHGTSTHRRSDGFERC